MPHQPSSFVVRPAQTPRRPALLSHVVLCLALLTLLAGVTAGLLTGGGEGLAASGSGFFTADAAALVTRPGTHIVCARSVIVRRGDTLSHLAPRTWRQVAASNHLRNPNLIRVGQRLCLAWRVAAVDTAVLQARLASGDARDAVDARRDALRASGGDHDAARTPPAPPPPSTPTPPPPPPAPSPPVTPTTPPPAPTPSPSPTSPPTPPDGAPGRFPNPWCNSAQTFPAGPLSQWTLPVGCYAGIYAMPAAAVPSWGWCNFIPEYLHYAQYGDTTAALFLPSHGGYSPVPGATVYFHPYEQGASADGHYATVIAVGAGGWVLIVESNFYWRGGGWAKIDFRYIHESAGVEFRY